MKKLYWAHLFLRHRSQLCCTICGITILWSHADLSVPTDWVFLHLKLAAYDPLPDLRDTVASKKASFPILVPRESVEASLLYM